MTLAGSLWQQREPVLVGYISAVSFGSRANLPYLRVGVVCAYEPSCRSHSSSVRYQSRLSWSTTGHYRYPRWTVRFSQAVPASARAAPARAAPRYSLCATL